MDDKIPFYALDLRNNSRLVKTKTKTRAQCLMVNTGSLMNEQTQNKQYLRTPCPRVSCDIMEFKFYDAAAATTPQILHI